MENNDITLNENTLNDFNNCSVEKFYTFSGCEFLFIFTRYVKPKLKMAIMWTIHYYANLENTKADDCNAEENRGMWNAIFQNVVEDQLVRKTIQQHLPKDAVL